MPPVTTLAFPRSTRLALAGLSLAMLMPSLATSSANVALPALAQVYGASFQAVQWIVLSYLLTVTALIVAAGRAGDTVGRRRLLLTGMIIFAGGSFLCGIAPTLGLLIAARILQGAGAAIMMALTLAFVGDIVPKAQTGSAMGLLGTMSAVGTTLGPALGGLLIACAGGRAIFLVNVPLALCAYLIAWRTLPKHAPRVASASQGFDIVGTGLFAVAITTYALAMTVGRGQFGLLNVALLTAAFVVSAAFVMVEAKVEVPLLPLRLFRSKALVASLSSSAIVSTVMMATLIVGPFYLTKVIGLGPASAGLTLAVGPLVAALAGVPAGRLVDRVGTDRATLAGLAAMAGGATLLSLVTPMFGLVGFLAPIIGITAGYGLFQAANNTSIMTKAEPAERGTVSGMLNLSRNLGLVTGASAMGAVFAWGTSVTNAVTAEPKAIVGGVHATFAAAAVLIMGALLIALRIKHGRMATETIEVA